MKSREAEQGASLSPACHQRLRVLTRIDRRTSSSSPKPPLLWSSSQLSAQHLRQLQAGYRWELGIVSMLRNSSEEKEPGKSSKEPRGFESDRQKHGVQQSVGCSSAFFLSLAGVPKPLGVGVLEKFVESCGAGEVSSDWLCSQTLGPSRPACL